MNNAVNNSWWHDVMCWNFVTLVMFCLLKMFFLCWPLWNVSLHLTVLSYIILTSDLHITHVCTLDCDVAVLVTIGRSRPFIGNSGYLHETTLHQWWHSGSQHSRFLVLLSFAFYCWKCWYVCPMYIECCFQNSRPSVSYHNCIKFKYLLIFKILSRTHSETNLQ